VQQEEHSTVAIDPLQRQMFGQRHLPGVNPAQVAGGIYNLRGLGPPQPVAQPVPVAARPLQVASLGQQPTGQQPTGQQPTGQQPIGQQPIGQIIASPQPQLNFQQQYDQATAQINAARQEQVPQADISALLEARSQIVLAAENAGQSLNLGEDELDERVNAGASSILAAADKAAESKIAESKGATDADANAAKANAANLASSLLNADKDPDMAALIKALGPSEINYDNWKEESKKLLGVDEDEADVPDWAAPMFLFGLNLMKGPVSSKTGQQGFGGLLADIGAAGEKGFAFFATERARKRKEKAQVATLAMELQSADAARKKLILDTYKAKAKADLDLDKAASSAYNDSINRVINLVPAGQEEKRALGIAAFGEQYRELLRAGVTEKQLLHPTTQLLLESYAAKQMGITKTPVKLDSMKFGGIDLNFSRPDLESARAKFNKANPQNQIGTMTEFLSKIIAKDPLVQNYQSLVIGQRADNVTSSTLNSVNADGENITEVIITKEGAREQWFADNPAPPATASQAEKDAYAAKVKTATPTWRFITETRLTDKPNYTERSFINKDGTQTKFYINEAAFGARRRSNPNLTLQDVLLNPEKYPKILGGKIKDYSKLQPNMATVTVGTGDKTKRVFSYDKTAYGQAIASGKIDPSRDNILEKMIELGIGGFAGKQFSTQTPTTMTVVDVDGSVISATGDDAEAMIAGFGTKQAEEQWRGRSLGLVNLNRLAHQIKPLLMDERGQYIASTVTDFGNFLESGARILSNVVGISDEKGQTRINNQWQKLANGTVNSIKIGSQRIISELSDEGQRELQKGLKVIRSGSLIFGGQAIQDKATRARAESMFVNLAFALASAREGGKLTDNDVKNALLTLGWDGSSFAQTPEAILTTLRGAVQDANNSYFEEAVFRMTDKKRKKHAEIIAAGNGNVVETLLRRAAEASDPMDTTTPMYNMWRAAQDDKDASGKIKPYRLQFHLLPEFRKSSGQTGGGADGGGADGTRRFLPVDQSFELGIPQNNRGAFTSLVDTARMPNTLRTIHKEVLFPGGQYNPVSSVKDFTIRIKSLETANRLEVLGFSEEAVTELVNQYLKYYRENSDLFVSP